MTLVRRLIGPVLACVAFVACAQESPVLVGTVSKVTDGDTINVELSSGQITVRLGSIDAPESNQPGGQEATDALKGLVLNQEVALDVVTQDRYERLVAIVQLGDGNVNKWLVEQGHAWAYRQYLEDTIYCRLEHEARAAERGLWRSERPVAPWEWRRGIQPPTDYSLETVANCISAKGRSSSSRSVSVPASSQPTGECLIKGNISGSGRIYHVPGSANYEATKIDVTKGERWFCSEQEAKAAGWRLPRG